MTKMDKLIAEFDNKGMLWTHEIKRVGFGSPKKAVYRLRQKIKNHWLAKDRFRIDWSEMSQAYVLNNLK